MQVKKKPGNPKWGGTQMESKLIKNMQMSGVEIMAILLKKENIKTKIKLSSLLHKPTASESNRYSV